MARGTDDFRHMTAERLDEEEAAMQKELLNLRFRHATRQLVNTNELVRAKRRLARIKTVRRERQIAEGT